MYSMVTDVFARRSLIRAPLANGAMEMNPRVSAGAGRATTHDRREVSKMNMIPDKLRIETELEDDGRWIADAPDLPGVTVYGATREEAIAKARELAAKVLAERGETP